MTSKDKAAIQRMIGIIEGVSYGIADQYAAAIMNAVATIDEILDREDVANDE